MHGLLSEALERLLFERLLTIVDDTDIPDVIRCNLLNRKATDNLLNDIEFNIEVARCFILYENFKQDIHSGNYGKTAQFWVFYYLNIMANQHMAVQENDFFLRPRGLKYLLPFCFALMPDMGLLMTGKPRQYSSWLQGTNSRKRAFCSSTR